MDLAFTKQWNMTIFDGLNTHSRTHKARINCFHKTSSNPSAACIQGLQQTLHSVVNSEKMSAVATVVHSEGLNKGPQFHVSVVVKTLRERDAERRSEGSRCAHHATKSSNLRDIQQYMT